MKIRNNQIWTKSKSETKMFIDLWKTIVHVTNATFLNDCACIGPSIVTTSNLAYIKSISWQSVVHFIKQVKQHP